MACSVTIYNAFLILMVPSTASVDLVPFEHILEKIASQCPQIGWVNISVDRVGEEMPLYDILNEFQKGHSHMAAVVKYNVEKTKLLRHDRELKQDRRKTAKIKKHAPHKDQKSRSKKLASLRRECSLAPTK